MTDKTSLGPTAWRRTITSQNIPARCQEFRENFGQQLVKSIIDAFIPDVGQRLSALHFAINSHNTYLIALEAHGLKGSCQNLGAYHLGEICCLIEDSAHSSEMASLPALAAELEVVWQQTLPYLEEEKNRAG